MPLDNERRINANLAVDAKDDNKDLFFGNPDIIAFLEHPGKIRVSIVWNDGLHGPRPISLTRLTLSEGNEIVQGTLNTNDQDLKNLATTDHQNPSTVLSEAGHRQLMKTMKHYYHELGIALINHDNIDDLIKADVIRVKLPGHE
jgi:hypothetical protein